MKKFLILFLFATECFAGDCLVTTAHFYRHQSEDLMTCLNVAKAKLGTTEVYRNNISVSSPYGGDTRENIDVSYTVEKVKFTYKDDKTKVRGTLHL